MRKLFFPGEQIFSYIYRERKESDSLGKLVAAKGLDITPTQFLVLGGWLREHLGVEGSPGRVIGSNGRRQGLRAPHKSQAL